jgi:hypothetical protein
MFHTPQKATPSAGAHKPCERWLSYFTARRVMLRGRTFTYRTGSPKKAFRQAMHDQRTPTSLHLPLHHHQPQLGDRL